MRVVFVGTVMSSYHALEELLINNVNVVGVFTLDQKYAQNVSDYIQLDPLCSQYNIPLYKFKSINDEECINTIQQLEPDYIFIIGLSQIANSDLLKIPKLGCIGAHPSLLPMGRGRASIPWAILSGQTETGVSFFFLDDGVDSGDLISQAVIKIEPRENATTLYNKINDSIRSQMKELIPSIKNGTVTGVAQNHNLATYTAKRSPEDGYIDWHLMSTECIDRLVRACTKPYPGAFTFYKDEKLIVWSAEPVNTNRYIAVPGQVVKINHSSVYVKTMDGILEIKEVSFRGEEHKAAEIITREGVKLGINFVKKLDELMERVKMLEEKLSGENGK